MKLVLTPLLDPRDRTFPFETMIPAPLAVFVKNKLLLSVTEALFWLVTAVEGRRALASVPEEILFAFSEVRFAPAPLKALAVTMPAIGSALIVPEIFRPPVRLIAP